MQPRTWISTCARAHSSGRGGYVRAQSRGEETWLRHACAQSVLATCSQQQEVTGSSSFFYLFQSPAKMSDDKEKEPIQLGKRTLDAIID